jgi:very-short-patch-repair endonuclease
MMAFCQPRIFGSFALSIDFDRLDAAMNALRAETDAPSRAVNELAEIVLGAARGSVLAIAGAGRERVARALDHAQQAHDDRLALFIPLEPAASTEEIVEQIADVLAETALRLWPRWWFSEADLADCRNDTLGRQAIRIIIRRLSEKTRSILRPWAEAAAMSALSQRKPRLHGVATATQIEQLCIAIHPAGLILVVDMEEAVAPSAALVHALEWISQNARAAVVALFAELPENNSPFDRILHGAVRIAKEPDPIDASVPEKSVSERTWLAPVRGIPHPLSETEQRLAKALAADRELAPLFHFNQCVETVHGHRPKVDLVWTAGRLVVELDGYADHGIRAAFIYDRHRDYELTLAGYTVLRLANDEIAQDIEKAIEKIRDIVQLCRARTDGRV